MSWICTALLIFWNSTLYYEKRFLRNNAKFGYLVSYIYLQFDGNITKVTLEDLVPFTRYVFKIEACTVAGCTVSADSRAVETHKAREYKQQTFFVELVCPHCPTARPIQTLKKTACVELCEGVHAAQRQRPTQIPSGFWAHFIGFRLCLGV